MTGISKPDERYRMVDEICAETNLYLILGVQRTVGPEALRRGYIDRSRICHPDKFQEYPKATEAFQKLACAYETLSKPSSRRAYDLTGKSNLSGSGVGSGEETLHGALYQLFLEFLDGDFETIRSLLITLSENNQGFNIAEDSIENLHKVFLQIRDLFLACQKYLNLVQFELIRLYEIQNQIRSLSYFDIFGRLRLTMEMARLALTIPLRIDTVMKNEAKVKMLTKSTKQSKGLLGDGISSLISGLVDVLESVEKYL
ncbi:hypothetical protein G9A89_018025 [Geosiphon pyriformis]|nr:hypothetical protein G9A89_018025 [Geosiphon pyriformis]